MITVGSTVMAQCSSVKAFQKFLAFVQLAEVPAVSAQQFCDAARLSYDEAGDERRCH
jgi:hypothetical protein